MAEIAHTDGSPKTYFVVDAGEQLAGPFETEKEAGTAMAEIATKAHRGRKFNPGPDALDHRAPGHFERKSR